LRTDLADAGIDYIDEAGRVIDFHTLRHTTGSLLAASGAHPKVAQSLMRHSDINLTMSRYTHILRGQESEVVSNLPDLSLPSGRKKALAGTDDMAVETGGSVYKPAHKKLTKNAYSGYGRSATVSTNQAEAKQGIERKDNSDKSLTKVQLGNKCNSVPSLDNSSTSTGPGRVRTYDQWIMSVFSAFVLGP
jgi:hypothetical protein